MTAPFALIPFDPGNESHQGFVYDSFRKSTDHWPWSEMPRGRLQDRLRRELATPGTETRIATPHDMPDSFLGWYAVRAPSTVVFAYTKYSARHQGIAAKAIRELGVHPGRSLAIVFWTATCARMQIARRDSALFFDTAGAYDEEQRRG